MSGFGWDYPPGVTGREPQITGEWPCTNCGRILPEEIEPRPNEPDRYEQEAQRLEQGVCPDGCPEDW